MPVTRTIKPIGHGGYSKDSWMYRRIVANPPTDPNGAARLANFLTDAKHWTEIPSAGAGGKKQFSTAIIETNNSDPLWTVTSYNWRGNPATDNKLPPVWMSTDGKISTSSGGIGYATNPANPVTWNGVKVGSFHLPENLAKLIADGSDAPLQARNVDTGEELHTWITIPDTANHHITVGHGAYVPDISKFDGRFSYRFLNSDGSYDGRHDMKVSASGIPQSSYTITIEELIHGIHHVVGMAVPWLLQRQVVDPDNPTQMMVQPCYPAAGSDGKILVGKSDNAEDYLEIGQLLWLPRSKDYSKKRWPFWMRNIVEAVQNYGMMPTDSNGPNAVTLGGICPNQYDEWLVGGVNPYMTRILGDSSDQANWAATSFGGGSGVDPFPWDDLVVLPACRTADDYAKLTEPDTLSAWDIVDDLADIVPETRSDVYISDDNTRGLALKAVSTATTASTAATAAQTTATAAQTAATNAQTTATAAQTAAQNAQTAATAAQTAAQNASSSGASGTTKVNTDGTTTTGVPVYYGAPVAGALPSAVPANAIYMQVNP